MDDQTITEEVPVPGPLEITLKQLELLGERYVGQQVCVLAAQSFRKHRSGRVLIALRDNQRAATSYTVPPICEAPIFGPRRS